MAKQFLLTGDLMLQSQANHLHRGDIARTLERNPGLLKDTVKELEAVVNDWHAMIAIQKEFRAQGCTIYICADDSIMISAVSGVGHPVIYSGLFKKFKSVSGLLKYFLKRCEAMQILRGKKPKLIGMLKNRDGSIASIARQLKVKADHVNQFIVTELYSEAVNSGYWDANYTTTDYGVYVAEFMP